ESPQSGWGYSNGSPPATSISGARRRNSSAVLTGGAPASARTRFSDGSISRSSVPVNSGRSAASRTRPHTPGHGRRPGPNGGTPRDRKNRNGVNGQNDSHGRS